MSFFERLANNSALMRLTNKFNFDTALACLVGVQVFNSALTCLTLKKTRFDVNQRLRGVEELDEEVESLSYDVRTLKTKLQDCLALNEKQKRELLVLKADTDERIYTLESAIQVVKSSAHRDVAEKSLHA